MSDLQARPSDLIKIHPIIGVQAMNLNHSGGWRLWLVCRALDKQGAGVVEVSVVKDYLKENHLAAQKIRRWIADALAAGFVEKIDRYTGVEILRYASEVNVAVMLKCERVDKRYVQLEISKLFREKWQSIIWEAYIGANHFNTLISRDRLEEITGVERHQQRRLEKKTKVKTSRNVVIAKQDASKEIGTREVRGKVAYSQQGRLRYRLPDTRTVVGGVDVSGRTRSKKTSQKIRKMRCDSVLLERGLKKEARIFYSDEKKARSSKYYGHEVFYPAPEQNDGGRTLWQEM